MTEVPDHLLQRSRERRAALGGGDAGAPTPPAGAASGSGDEPQEAPGRAVATTADAAPAVVEEAPPPPPPPPYVQAALDRKKLPVYMGPIGVAALLWVFVYAGVLFSPEATITDPVLAHGEEVYASQCAGCHGGAGQGGTGRRLAGEVFLTFPNIEDHIAWVVEGSPAAGTPYGDPDRPGGQHISQEGFGAMPGFGGVLSEEDILAVVRYEREVLDDAPPDEGSTAGGAPAGEEDGTPDEGPGTRGQDTPSDPANEAETEGGDVGDAESSEDPGSGDEGADEVTPSEGDGGETADDDPDTGGGAGASTGGEPDQG